MCKVDKITVRLSAAELKQIIKGDIHITLREKMKEKLVELNNKHREERVKEYHLTGL